MFNIFACMMILWLEIMFNKHYIIQINLNKLEYSIIHTTIFSLFKLCIIIYCYIKSRHTTSYILQKVFQAVNFLFKCVASQHRVTLLITQFLTHSPTCSLTLSITNVSLKMSGSYRMLRICRSIEPRSTC